MKESEINKVLSDLMQNSQDLSLEKFSGLKFGKEKISKSNIKGENPNP